MLHLFGGLPQIVSLVVEWNLGRGFFFSRSGKGTGFGVPTCFPLGRLCFDEILVLLQWDVPVRRLSFLPSNSCSTVVSTILLLNLCLSFYHFSVI